MKTAIAFQIFGAALLALTLSFPAPAAAAELEDAVARGAKLFADASLGTSGKSCNSCHTKLGMGDAPLTGRAPFPKVFSMAKKVLTLDQTVQNCFVGALKGSPLAWDDAKLTDLVAYVSSLYQKK